MATKKTIKKTTKATKANRRPTAVATKTRRSTKPTTKKTTTKKVVAQKPVVKRSTKSTTNRTTDQTLKLIRTNRLFVCLLGAIMMAVVVFLTATIISKVLTDSTAQDKSVVKEQVSILKSTGFHQAL